MLAHRGELSADSRWVVEPKWDGFRVLAFIRDRSVKLYSWNGHEFSKLFGSVSRELESLAMPAVLDGEVVMLDREGRPDFEGLQGVFERRRAEQRRRGMLTYIVFDCLYLNGHDLSRRPLEDRQAGLREAIKTSPDRRVRLVETFPGRDAQLLYEKAHQFGIEGVVLKRLGSPYRPGVRSKDWVKVPIREREEFVVAGYIANSGDLSSLILGQPDGKGKLVYTGLVGTGFSAETNRQLLTRLESLQRKRCPFATLPVLADHWGEVRLTPEVWVKPGLVVEVEYRQRTGDGLRHAAYKGVRMDKGPRDTFIDR